MKKKFNRLSLSFDEEEKKIEDKFSKADNIFLQTNNTPTSSDNKKPEKTKIIKISISMSMEEFQTLEDLRFSFASARKSVTRSEVIRTGIASLATMNLEELNSVHNNLKNLILQRGRKKETTDA